MRYFKILLTALLILCASGAYAQVNQPYSTLKEIYDDLTKIKPTDAKALLGEGGFLSIAFDMANREMMFEQKPDVETCIKIAELGVTMMIVLQDSGNEITQVLEQQYQNLRNYITAYNKMIKNRASTEAYLDNILEKKTLGDVELYELFLNKYGVAISIIREYNKDTKDPVNAIRILVIEGLRRRFEVMSNEKGISEYVSSEITKSDFFKIDSEIYKTWMSIVEDLKEKKLEARTTEEKEKLKAYKIKIKSISKFEVK